MTERKPKRGAPGTINWALIDEAWQAGIKTLQAIADEYEKKTGRKITRAGIKKHYDDLGVPRNLAGKIKAKAEALVNKELVNELVDRKSLLTESDIVEANAQQQKRIILTERKDVTKAKTIVMALWDEFGDQITNNELYAQLGELLQSQDDKGFDKLNELYQRVISFPGRVDGAKKLSDALKTLIDLERKVYKIDDVDSEKSSQKVFVEVSFE